MHEMAGETFLFAEEIQGLMTENLVPSVAPPIDTGSSFTALLGLPANQAVEVLLHEPESKKSSVIPVAEIWNDKVNDEETLGYSFKCSPTFPTNAALIERAAKFSIFAFGENSPESSSVPSNSTENTLKLKSERTNSESNPTSSQIFSVVPKNQNEKQRSTKRKERGEKKVKCCGTAKKSKNVENGSSKIGGEINKDEEKLPYFHVRARRGQATDSHSLAERARREKINARMKLLQELVPGCSKISGTALVLDEIINHVQALQRQVEFLSMRLSAVIPRIDFNLDSLLVAESGYLFSGNSPSTLTVEPSMWPEFQLTGARRHQHQNQYPQLLQVDGPQAPITPENLLFGYDSSPCSVSLQSSQLKMEL